MIKKILSVLCIAVILCTGASCKKELLTFDEYGTEARFLDEEFFGIPDLILRATVEEEKEVYFTNPKDKRKDDDGRVYQNAQVTVYRLKVEEIYKGTWAEEELLLKIFNGKGMSPELFLTGKDDKYVLQEKPVSYYLETGKEYILGLSVMSPEMEATFGDDGGFIVRFGPKVWCFTADENGVYSNLDTLANDRAFTVEELKASIASLKQ
jgi:hypothetical protein